jgi:hypothetical protein
MIILASLWKKYPGVIKHYRELKNDKTLTHYLLRESERQWCNFLTFLIADRSHT